MHVDAQMPLISAASIFRTLNSDCLYSFVMPSSLEPLH
jgi:hypothetical protein